MAKKKSLTDAIAADAGVKQQAPTEVSDKSTQSPAPKSKKTPARRNTKMVGGYYPLEVNTQVRILSAELGITQQALLARALNQFFEAHGKNPIAPE
ncbi:MAG: ribbon-helix-helix domain-containing protein [Cyanobacteria bacterium J06598_1]